MSFLIIVAKIIYDETRQILTSYLFVLIGLSGMYVSSNLTTSSPNSLMILCTVLICLLIIMSSSNKIELKNNTFVLVFSILAVGMIFSKIILAPLLLLLIIYILLFHSKIHNLNFKISFFFFYL